VAPQNPSLPQSFGSAYLAAAHGRKQNAPLLAAVAVHLEGGAAAKVEWAVVVDKLPAVAVHLEGGAAAKVEWTVVVDKLAALAVQQKGEAAAKVEEAVIVVDQLVAMAVQ